MLQQPTLQSHAAPVSTWTAPIAERALLRELVQSLGGHAGEIGQADIATCLTLRRIRPDVPLLLEGAPTQALYILRSGSLKCVRTLEDGYEQVLSFALPGELVGFDALHLGRQSASVVALEDSIVYVLPMSEVRGLRQACPALDEALQLALSRQLARAAGIAQMMSAVGADVRLARFLLWMSARMTEAGQSPRRLLLRMCRRDIASLLGVAHETVSRSFSQLVDAGLLRVDNRDVEILDFEGLRLRALSTRRPVEDAPRPAVRLRQKRPASTPQVVWFPRIADRSAMAAGR